MTSEYKSWKESKLQSTGQAHPDDWREYRESSEDWARSFDDMDGADWADYMGGPDDDEIESYYEGQEEFEGPLDHVEENFGEEDTSEEANHWSVSRMKEIVEWLADSKLARKFRNREGFFVPKGPCVRLKDGSVVDLLNWLFEEGIKGGVAIAGYSVVYSKPNSGYGEKLSFFTTIVEAPFEPPSKAIQEMDFEDDDIPF